MPARIIEDADLTYPYGDRDVLTLKPSGYFTPGFRADDGIVDGVAVDRFIAEQAAAVTLTGREAVCAIARLAAAGFADSLIGERFDRSKYWAAKIRERHGIATRVHDEHGRVTGAAQTRPIVHPNPDPWRSTNRAGIGRSA